MNFQKSDELRRVYRKHTQLCAFINEISSGFDSLWWHVYLRVEVAALLHKCADCKPKAVGQAELVDGSQQRNVVAIRI